jgi:uncharacterized protein YjbI with pentapeptide repeats
MKNNPHRFFQLNSHVENKKMTSLDFSHSDIRGMNFSGANLVGANFSYSRAGQSLYWKIGLFLSALLLSMISAYVMGYAGGIAGYLMIVEASLTDFSSGVLVLLILGVFIFVAIKQGLGNTAIRLAIGVIFFLVLAAGLGETSLIAPALFQSLATTGSISGALITSVALTWLKLLLRNSSIAIFIHSILFAIFSVLGAWEAIETKSQRALNALPVDAIITGSLFFLSIYISLKTSEKDKKFSLIYKSSKILASFGGTCFRGADLTDANFTSANLPGVNFRDSTLVRTCWFEAKKLEYSLTIGTSIEHPIIRDLLVKKQGENQNFDSLNLCDLNLENADLKNASFNGANLSGSNFKNANLSGAKLTRTQLYNSNLKGVCLTGAYIENWGISTETNLLEIKCDYIYMHLPTEQDPDPHRKPDNRNELFKEGDFSNFIAPIIKMLDLYQQQNVDPRRIAANYKTIDLFHHERIDPRATVIALKKLAEQHPEAGLEVVALEGRGDEKIRLQARVTDQADRSQLSAEYFTKYQEAAALPYSDMQSLLAAMAEKDQRIRSLENMVMISMQSDKFYVETYYDLGKHDEETPPVRKILILTANPKNTSKLRLDAEVREIQTGLERSKKRDQFEIITKWAVRPEDLRRALLDHEPQIVHFSGHGVATEGLALENETGQTQMVSTAALASLFEVFKDKVECVLLNACYSVEQAEAIRQYIPYVIGMNHEIGDRAALEFAVGFYDALGAGCSIDDAFKLGCVSIDLEGIPESQIPVLKHKDHPKPR